VAQYHESAETLRAETREMHRALRSLIEELEAIDWYAQRIDASDDAELASVLAHNRDEEKEVRLYLEESFSAEQIGPEAAVPLLATEEGDERLARARVQNIGRTS